MLYIFMSFMFVTNIAYFTSHVQLRIVNINAQNVHEWICNKKKRKVTNSKLFQPVSFCGFNFTTSKLSNSKTI